jgi:hypothetical protein
MTRTLSTNRHDSEAFNCPFNPTVQLNAFERLIVQFRTYFTGVERTSLPAVNLRDFDGIFEATGSQDGGLSAGRR